MAAGAVTGSRGDRGFFVTALWQQQGRYGRLIQVLETAEKFVRAPSHWLGGLDGEWAKKDHLLTLALTAYKDGLCSCGKPLVVAHNDDSDGWYEARESVCHSCAAVDRHRYDTEKPPPGGKVYAVHDPDGIRAKPA